MGSYGRGAEEVGSDEVRSTRLLPLPRDQQPRAYLITQHIWGKEATVGTHQFSVVIPPSWGSLGTWIPGLA